MSRSRKKTMYDSNNVSNKSMKKIANHRLRQKLKDPEFSINGREYRKVTDRVEDNDYKVVKHQSFNAFYEEMISEWQGNVNKYGWFEEMYPEPPSRDEAYRQYQKTYVSK